MANSHLPCQHGIHSYAQRYMDIWLRVVHAGTFHQWDMAHGEVYQYVSLFIPVISNFYFSSCIERRRETKRLTNRQEKKKKKKEIYKILLCSSSSKGNIWCVNLVSHQANSHSYSKL